MLWGKNRGKWKGQQPPGIEPRTPGLCSQCSATELWQLDNHQPSQSSLCTAQLAEHWLHKSDEVRFLVTVGLFTFPYFHLRIPTRGKSSAQNLASLVSKCFHCWWKWRGKAYTKWKKHHVVWEEFSLMPSPGVFPGKKQSGLVNKSNFLGLFPKSGKDQWDCEISNYYIALSLQQ